MLMSPQPSGDWTWRLRQDTWAPGNSWKKGYLWRQRVGESYMGFCAVIYWFLRMSLWSPFIEWCVVIVIRRMTTHPFVASAPCSCSCNSRKRFITIRIGSNLTDILLRWSNLWSDTVISPGRRYDHSQSTIHSWLSKWVSRQGADFNINIRNSVDAGDRVCGS